MFEQNLVEIANTLGSFAAAIAAVVAIVQLGRAIKVYRLEKTRAEAAQKRETLNEISSNTHRIALAVRDDMPALSGATGVVKELDNRLGLLPSRKEFWACLKEPAFIHSVFVTGWESTPQIADLRDDINHLQKLSERIRGLPILLTGVEFILLIHRWTYSSNHISKRFLSGDSMREAMRPVEKSRSVSRLTRHLNTHIVGDAYLFSGITKDALTFSTVYVKEVCELLLKLPDKDLIEAFDRQSQSSSYFGLEYYDAIELATEKAARAVQEESMIGLEEKNLLDDYIQKIGECTSFEYGMDKIKEFVTKSSVDNHNFFMPSISATTPDTEQDLRSADES